MPIFRANLEWIYTSGGPLVLLPTGAAPRWMGAAANPSGASHYEQACNVSDLIGVLVTDSGWVLVLGDEPMQTAWISRGTGGLLVRWMWAPSEAHILAALPEDGDFESVHSLTFRTEPGLHTLMDAAVPGQQVTDALQLELPPPATEWHIATRVYSPDPSLSLVVHRLTPGRAKVPTSETNTDPESRNRKSPDR